MKLICLKPPREVQEAAKRLSSALGRAITAASDWPSTQELMNLNHKLMRMFGWFKEGHGFVEFKA